MREDGTERNGGEEKIACGRKTKCHVIIAVGVPSEEGTTRQGEKERRGATSRVVLLLLLLFLVLATGR